MEERLTVGLLGCGRVARLVHMDALRRLPDVEVAAVADPDPAARADAARRFPRARAHDDYRDLLREGAVDAAVVCLPNALHAEAARATLEAGLHLYLEKPLATDLEAARGVLAAASTAPGVAVMGFNFRFNANLRAARRALEAARLGDLHLVRSVFASAPGPLAGWMQRRDAGGGALLDLGSHHFDLIPFLLGRKIQGVRARVWSRRTEADSASVEVELADATPVQCFFSLAAFDADHFEFLGSRDRLRVDRRKPVTIVDRLLAPRRERSFDASLAAFVRWVRSGRSGGGEPAAASLDDGYRSLQVVLAAERSAATGRRVQLEDANPEDPPSQ